MCEICMVVREQAWAEIRDLMNYNRKVVGPLSAAIKERVELLHLDPDLSDEYRDSLDLFAEAIRAEMIAVRCADVARACPGSQFHKEPQSMVMGVWAGNALQEEQREAAGQMLHLLRELFGGEDD